MTNLVLSGRPLMNKPHAEMDAIDHAIANAAVKRVQRKHERAHRQMLALTAPVAPFTPQPSLTALGSARAPRVGPRGKIVRSDVVAIAGPDRLIHLVENDYRPPEVEPTTRRTNPQY